MADKHICVAIYTTHAQADEAFSRLEVAGFGMHLLSFAGRDYWANMVGSHHAGDRFVYCGGSKPFWERLWANLNVWGVFCFFENGPLLVAGSLVRTIVRADGNGNGNKHGDPHLSGFVAGLSGIGIQRDSLLVYEKALLNDQILLFVFGSIEEVDHAQRLLNETKAINHTLHHGIEDYAD